MEELPPTGAEAGIECPRRRNESDSRRCSLGGEPDAWVQKGVEEIGDERHHEVDDADDEDAARQQRKVLCLRCV